MYFKMEFDFAKKTWIIMDRFKNEQEMVNYFAYSEGKYSFLKERFVSLTRYEKFIPFQQLTLNDVFGEPSEIFGISYRYNMIVEAGSDEDIASGRYRIVDLRNYERAIKSCRTPIDHTDYTLTKHLERWTWIENRFDDMSARPHRKDYRLRKPSMAHNYSTFYYEREPFDEDDIPDNIRIKAAVRPKNKKDRFLRAWGEKLSINENNWKSKKIRRQYLANKERHCYTAPKTDLIQKTS